MRTGPQKVSKCAEAPGGGNFALLLIHVLKS